MLEAQVGTRGSQQWKQWDTCLICGFDYPRDEIVYVNGGPYCTRLGHFRDTPGTGGIKEGG